MKKIEESKTCPNFSFISTDKELSQLKDFKNQIVVLYFYPRDNTPGCSCEAEDFKKSYKKFLSYNAQIIGVSRDGLSSHERFIEKFKLPFPLISDSNEEICALFDVIKEKNMYGKKVIGIERSTFLIDASGKIRRIWRKVKVDGHVAEVLQAVKDLQPK